MHKCIHIQEAKNFSRSFYIGHKFFNNMHWDITELCPFENGWVNFIVFKSELQSKKWYIFNQLHLFWNSVIFSKDVIFKKIQNSEKKLTGSELNKIKYHIKWPKILQKNYLFVIFYKTETCKVSKFLLLSNLDCKKYIYANKIPFYLSRSSFKAKLFCRIF